VHVSVYEGRTELERKSVELIRNESLLDRKETDMKPLVSIYVLSCFFLSVQLIMFSCYPQMSAMCTQVIFRIDEVFVFVVLSVLSVLIKKYLQHLLFSLNRSKIPLGVKTKTLRKRFFDTFVLNSFEGFAYQNNVKNKFQGLIRIFHGYARYTKKGFVIFNKIQYLL
jgi:hypothetical protein